MPEVSQDQTLWGLFEQQAAATPDAPALEFGGSSLSYAQLLAEAERLSAVLFAAYGNLENRLIGICLQRSTAMIAAVLVANRLGAAYVALDPDYPPERLGLIITDARLAVILTDGESAPRIPAVSTPLLRLDFPARSTAHVAPVVGGPETSVYVLYTSGSTGTPKGVTMPQRALLNLMAWQLESFVHTRKARTLQFTSLNFDVSFQEIFSTLLGGGTLVLVDRETRRDPALLTRYLGTQRIERLFLPFVALQALAEEATRTSTFPTQLREVITAGEQLKATPQLRAFFNRLEGCALVNHYGPSETHVVSSYVLDKMPDCWEQLPPIGYAIPNCQLYVLDDQMRSLEPGAEGELHIGGVQLADGYLNRPELTAERFVPNPFGAGRLYRTGDRVRARADGAFEFVGRADDQVKVRGFRVELGEVEAALLQHPEVQDAAVLACDGLSEGKELVAYVVAKSSSPSGLREFLCRRLPEHMIPSLYVLLERLPTTPSGKVDRRALPPPPAPALGLGSDSQASLTEEERTLTQIWSEVLQIPRIGLDDNFFTLGGHSLKATQIVSRARAATRAAFSVQDLFDYPTIRELAARLPALQAEQVAEHPEPIIPEGSERGRAEVASSYQERLWLIEQESPGTPTYNIPFTLDIRGRVDPEKLVRSLQTLVERHEVLRTTYHLEAGRLVQQVHAGGSAPVERFEFTELTEPLEEHTWRFVRRPFDLEREMPIRAQLVRLEPEHHQMTICVHHIAFDGWSMGVFLDEFSHVYSALAEGREPLAEAPVPQYREYSRTERLRRKSPEYARQLEYWLGELQGCNPVLELPTDKRRPPTVSHRGATFRFEVPNDLYQDLRRFADTVGVSAHMVLLSAFQTLLHRYTGQEDFLIGISAANRSEVGLERLLGFLVSTLVLRARVRPEMSFRSLLAQVRRSSLEALANQDVPVEEVIRRTMTRRDPSRNPLFQAMFIMETEVPEQLAFGETTARLTELDTGAAKVDLSLAVAERGGYLFGSFEYSTDLFEPETISRMAGHFLSMVAAALIAPDSPIHALALLSEGEREQLLGHNTPVESGGGQQPVTRLFEEQVAKTPYTVAVTFRDQQLTYRELNLHANQLARFLQERGVGPETLVGICLQRSPRMITAALGILKAGAAYLPLDPGFPKDRLAFILADSEVSALITEQDCLDALPELSAPSMVWEEITENTARYADANLEDQAQPHYLAYVIYTSGSTGRPKGVMIPHSALSNLLISMLDRPGFTSRDVMLAVTTFSFDIAALELFLPLLNGGRAHIAESQQASDADRLRELLDASGATVMQATPATWGMLLSAGWQGSRSLKKVLCGGETMPPSLAEQLLRCGLTVWNMYGPTEATIWCSTYELTDAHGYTIPIGKAVSNVVFHILNQRLELAPFGMVGELYIGGAQLADGYLKRPELTAERFVPNPFGEGRLYRTGDLARWRPDGNLEYLGRSDHQVKIRGFRVELEEVEAVLSQHPQVQDAAVVAREDRPGNKRLAAYVTARGEDKPNSAELRSFMKTKLPDYMVPNIFILLDALPLTPNGKIDRRALPVINTEIHTQSDICIAPRNPTEQTLAAIFAEVLGLKQVSIHEDFFELGGHSLSAMRVVQRLATKGITLRIGDLYKYPTPAGLASILTNPLVLPKFHEHANSLYTESTDLLPFQQWFFGRGLSDPSHFNLGYVWDVSPPLSEDTLMAALDALEKRQSALSIRFRLVDRGWVQRPAGSKNHLMSFVRMSGLGDQASIVDDIANKMSSQIDIRNGPLFAVTYIDNGSGHKDSLILAVNHLVFDDQSVSIFHSELETLCRSIETGSSPALATITTIQRWASQLKSYVTSPGFEPELRYWVKLMDKQCGTYPCDVDMDQVDQIVTINGSGIAPLLFSSTKHSRSVKGLIEKALVALCMAFHHEQKGTSLLVSVARHGRQPVFNDLDLSNTIGWLQLATPILVELDESNPNSFKRALGKTSAALEQIPNEGVGFIPAQFHLSDTKLAAQLKNFWASPNVSLNLTITSGHYRDARFGPVSSVPIRSNTGPPRTTMIRFAVSVDTDQRMVSVSAAYNKRYYRSIFVEKMLGEFLKILAIS